MKTNKMHLKLIGGKHLSSLVIGLVLSFSLYAQAGPPPPPPPPPAGGPQQLGVQSVNTYQAKVVKLSVNDDYVYDGFYIVNNGDTINVQFPPHLGSQVTSVIKTGTPVLVNGVLNVTPRGEKEIRMVSVAAGSKTIAVTGIPPADIPPAETYTSGKGRVKELQTNREGEVNGLIVDSGIILRVPPHIVRQLGSAISVNADIAYTGVQKISRSGESLAADYKIVRCRTITINGQQYMVE